MALPVRRRRKTQFQRAADGSMTLLEHLYELRTRLFRASLAIVAGMIGGWFLSGPVTALLEEPYCRMSRTPTCNFIALGLTDPFSLRLKVAHPRPHRRRADLALPALGVYRAGPAP